MGGRPQVHAEVRLVALAAAPASVDGSGGSSSAQRTSGDTRPDASRPSASVQLGSPGRGRGRGGTRNCRGRVVTERRLLAATHDDRGMMVPAASGAEEGTR